MKNIKGQSLFEVVLALFIITLILVAVVILATNSISNSVSSRNKTTASKYTQQASEWLELQKVTSFSTLNQKANSSAFYCLNSNLDFLSPGKCSSSSTLIDGKFSRELSFSFDTVNSKTVIIANIVTSWEDSRGTHEARSITQFTDTD